MELIILSAALFALMAGVLALKTRSSRPVPRLVRVKSKK